MSIDFSKAYAIFVKYWPLFFAGLKSTVLFAIVGTFLGLIIGLVVGGLRALEITEWDSTVSRIFKRIVKVITGLYIWVFRGTPMMCQAVFLYYLLKPLLGWTSFVAGLCIISVNTGAYMAEIIRSGIQSVDKGQTEASKAIGMSTTQTLLYIIFPQAIKNSFPSIGNQLIVNIKDSSMLNCIAVTELFFYSTSVAGTNMRYIETFLVSLILYLILTTLATLLLNFIESKLNNEDTNRGESIEFCS